jgi:hypothetical protein
MGFSDDLAATSTTELFLDGCRELLISLNVGLFFTGSGLAGIACICGMFLGLVRVLEIFVEAFEIFTLVSCFPIDFLVFIA